MFYSSDGGLRFELISFGDMLPTLPACLDGLPHFSISKKVPPVDVLEANVPANTTWRGGPGIIPPKHLMSGHVSGSQLIYEEGWGTLGVFLSTYDETEEQVLYHIGLTAGHVVGDGIPEFIMFNPHQEQTHWVPLFFTQRTWISVL